MCEIRRSRASVWMRRRFTSVESRLGFVSDARVRIFQNVKGLLHRPIRICEKPGAPRKTIIITRAAEAMTGARISSSATDTTRSTVRFISRLRILRFAPHSV